MKRVLIIGSPGAGKSTLAQKLAARTGLPLIHLDDLYWDAGWARVEHGLWLSRLAEALPGERWILDGNFSSSLLRRAYAADTVIFLRPPRWLRLWSGVLARTVGALPSWRPSCQMAFQSVAARHLALRSTSRVASGATEDSTRAENHHPQKRRTDSEIYGYHLTEQD